MLWAAELAAAYASELQVLGVAASAPGAELAATLKLATDRPTTVTSGRCGSWCLKRRLPAAAGRADLGRPQAGRPRAQQLQKLAAGPQVAAVRPIDLLTTPPWPALLARNTPGTPPRRRRC